MASYRPRPPSPRRYADPRASTGTMIATSFDTRPPRYLYEAQPVARQNYIDNGYDRGTTSRTQYVVRPRNNSFMADENRRPSNIPLDPRRPIINPVTRERPRSPPKSQRPRDDADRYLAPSAVNTRQDYNHQRHHSATPIDMDRLIVANKSGRERGTYRRQEPNGPKIYPAPASRPAIRLDDGFSYTGPREQFERDFPARAPQRRENQAPRERPISALNFHDFKPPSTSRRDLGPPPATTRQFDRIERLEPPRPELKPVGGNEFDRPDDFPRRRHSVRVPVVHQKRDEDFTSSKDEFDARRSSRHAKARYDDEDYPRTRESGPRERDYERDREPRFNEPRRQPRSRENSPERTGNGVPSTPGLDSRRLPRSRDNSPERSLGKGLAPPPHDSRRKPRSRESSPDKSGNVKAMAATGIGGLAAATLASSLKKDSREKDPREKDDSSDPEARRERRRRRRREKERERELRESEDPRLETDPTRDRPSPSREEAELVNGRREIATLENSGSESQDKQRKHRRHRRHRSDKESQPDGNPEDPGHDRIPVTIPMEASRDDMRDRDDEADLNRRSRSEYQNRDREVAETSLVTRTLSPGENEDDRPRRVQLVEPVKEKEPEVKPKGILKPARQVPFPEDPHPTREGVAPLKEPGKDGLPVEARWTKISRMLVNPEALELAKERFEEREDYVIVLRVISKEEIAKLAEKTREIREARELEWQEELERRKRSEKKQRRRHDSSNSDSDSASDSPQPRLAVGAPQPQPPPPGAPFDPRAYQGAPLDPRAYQPPQEPPGRSMLDMPPPPAVNAVPENYSTNV